MLTRIIAATVSILALVMPGVAAADFLGLYVGGGVWSNDFSGDVLSMVDVEDQLGLSSDSSTDVYVAFEHPVPFIPNVRVAQAGIEESGNGTVLTAFTFEGVTFAPTDTVGSSLDLTYTDLTLYYEVLDTGVNLDLGITARKFDGELEINATRQAIDGYLPMLYVGARINLPFSGFYVGGTANAVAVSDSSLTDYTAKLGWSTESFIFPEFGIEAGYRVLNFDADENDVDVNFDVDVSGPFVNLVAHF